MLAGARTVPKLTLSISPAASQGAASSRQGLSLKSPAMIPRTPISPSPISPTARNTKLNQRGFSSFQQPTFSYVNQSSSKSILKKNQAPNSRMDKRIQFSGEPTVHCVTPIENPDDYYGSYVKMSRDERRWGLRS